MNYENSFLFGRNASIINEAYSKMYSPRRNRSRLITEAGENEPDDEELLGKDLGLSNEQRDYIRNFDAEKEYKDIMAAEKRGREEGEDIEDEEVSDVRTTPSNGDSDDEDTENFMSSFNSGKERGSGKGGDDDFIFSYSRYGNQPNRRYPEWLVRAAEAAGHKLPGEDDGISGYGGHGAKNRTLAQSPRGASVFSSDDDGGTPWDNLWENIIVANPDVFNSERYDMDELPKHKREFYERWKKYFSEGNDEIESAENALEEIPGCGCKIEDEESDFVGNLDGEDFEDETEEPEKYENPWDRTGFGIVVKGYERDFSPDARAMKMVERYITPPQFKGTIYETKEEAIEALRDYMTELIGDPSDVYIGVVLDNSITNKIFNGDGFETITDKNGKPKKVKLNSTVYTISSSDKENTDRCFSYESGNWVDRKECDEYLQ